MEAVLNKNEVTEVTRLTVSGAGRELVYNFSWTLKEMAKVQSEKTQKISLWVAEEIPLVFLINAIEEVRGIRFFLPTSISKIGTDTVKTHKGLCLNHGLWEALKQITFRDLMKAMLRQRRMMKND